MGSITGLGGVFIKANDPQALAKWYQDNLGIDFKGNVYTELPLTGSGYNVLSFFVKDSNYFNPSTSPIMLNLRVSGLFELLEDLKAKGVTLVGDPMDEEYGKFGWILDGEGNKIELWEPPV